MAPKRTKSARAPPRKKIPESPQENTQKDSEISSSQNFSESESENEQPKSPALFKESSSLPFSPRLENLFGNSNSTQNLTAQSNNNSSSSDILRHILSSLTRIEEKIVELGKIFDEIHVEHFITKIISDNIEIIKNFFSFSNISKACE